jgi:hypothetical protein
MPRLSDEQILAWINPAWFWSKVQRGAPECCWSWTGDTNTNGYGQVSFWRHNIRLGRTGAHRVAYLLGTRQPVNNLDVLHHCDNPPCCNYETCLFTGTQKDNMADKAAKGRGRGPEKITAAQVAEIKRRYGTGESSLVLAAQYDIGYRQIHRIGDGTSRTLDSTPLVTPDWKRKGMFKSDTKLTDEQVADIRQRYAAGGITQHALAAEHGIDQGHVSAIINGKKRKGGGGS